MEKAKKFESIHAFISYTTKNIKEEKLMLKTANGVGILCVFVILA